MDQTKVNIHFNNDNQSENEGGMMCLHFNWQAGCVNVFEGGSMACVSIESPDCWTGAYKSNYGTKLLNNLENINKKFGDAN